jgi:arylsulfatase A-like enzyme
MAARVSQAFSRDEVRRRVIPAYMGLIKQIDDQIGVLMRFLADRGLLDTTMIVFTSDHGDYLGDHWLGEKDLFHDCSAKVPLIVVDPSPQADVTRGTTSGALVEAIDLAPSFIRYFGGKPKPHILEGRPLQPLLHGQPLADWRRHVSPNTITRQCRRGGRWEPRSMRPDCSWSSMDVGNTSTPSTSVQCCMIWPPIRTNSSTEAPIPPTHPNALG